MPTGLLNPGFRAPKRNPSVLDNPGSEEERAMFAAIKKRLALQSRLVIPKH